MKHYSVSPNYIHFQLSRRNMCLVWVVFFSFLFFFFGEFFSLKHGGVLKINWLFGVRVDWLKILASFQKERTRLVTFHLLFVSNTSRLGGRGVAGGHWTPFIRCFLSLIITCCMEIDNSLELEFFLLKGFRFSSTSNSMQFFNHIFAGAILDVDQITKKSQEHRLAAFVGAPFVGAPYLWNSEKGPWASESPGKQRLVPWWHFSFSFWDQGSTSIQNFPTIAAVSHPDVLYLEASKHDKHGTPPKSNMTAENPPFEVHFLLDMVIFHRHE